jgi:hypothetical protein
MMKGGLPRFGNEADLRRRERKGLNTKRSRSNSIGAGTMSSGTWWDGINKRSRRSSNKALINTHTRAIPAEKSRYRYTSLLRLAMLLLVKKKMPMTHVVFKVNKATTVRWS